MADGRVKKGLLQFRWLGVLLVAVLGGIFIVLTPKISKEERLLQSGLQKLSAKKYTEALDDLESSARYAPNSKIGLSAANKGAHAALYEAFDFKRAIELFRLIVLHAQDQEVIKKAQRQIADIYFDKFNDYTQAILEYQRLLDANLNPIEAQETRIRIAKSYFYMANFEQAIFEANEFLRMFQNQGDTFEVHMLIGNSLMAMKRTDLAIAQYEKIEKLFADSNQSYQATLNKALVYEEKEDFKHAEEALKSILNKYPQPDVLELKIAALKKRAGRIK